MKPVFLRVNLHPCFLSKNRVKFKISGYKIILLLFLIFVFSAEICLYTAPEPVFSFIDTGATALTDSFVIDKEEIFKTMEGKELSVGAYKGRVTFLYIWAGWSPYCIEGLKIFSDFERKTPNAVCLYLNAGGSATDINFYLKENSINLGKSRILLDQKNVIDSSIIAAVGLPITLVYNRNSVFFKQYNGVLDIYKLEGIYALEKKS